MKFRALASIVAALALCGAQAAAVEPDGTLPLNYRPAPDSDEGGLWMMADTLEKNMQASPLLVRDPALNAYVKGVMCKLVPDRCRTLRIYILDIPYFNAAMAPNGSMQIWTGLLLRTRNEAQLAFVLGHEISHYTLRHTIAEWRRARSTSGTMAFLTIATAGLAGLAYFAALDSLMSFSRDEERAADMHGAQIAADAGYDPTQDATLWREISAEETSRPKRDSEYSFTRTHPTTAERLTTMEKNAESLKTGRANWMVGQDACRRAMQPFRSQWLEEDLSLGNYEGSVTLLNTMIADEPASGELRYYLAEAYRRRNADGDSAKAIAAYREAVATGNAPPAVYRGLGIAEMKLGDKITARDAFEKYLAALPDASDRTMVEYYLTHL
ncbi:MAG: M48 family metalloprotease [Alphaproteobacteria bacterium]|nr:M48 family metalloprotease [Alphaproteobacteria bacterium]